MLLSIGKCVFRLDTSVPGQTSKVHSLHLCVLLQAAFRKWMPAGWVAVLFSAVLTVPLAVLPAWEAARPPNRRHGWPVQALPRRWWQMGY